MASITVSPASITRHSGETFTLSASATDATGNPISVSVFTWSSSDTSIAIAGTPPGTFIVRATTGTATLSAQSGGKTGSSVLSVVPVPIAKVTVGPASFTVAPGQTMQMTASLTDSAGHPGVGVATWASSNPSVGSVTENGLVTARAVGTTTITATVGGVSGSTGMTVQNVPVGVVALAPVPSRQFSEGDTIQLAATVRDANGAVVTDRPIAWSTSKPQLVDVSPTGLASLVRGAFGGSALVTITATAEGKSASVNLVVNEWSLTRTTDQTTLRSTSILSLLADPLNSTEGMAATFRCSNHVREFYVATSSFTESGAITYRLANKLPASETWFESTNFQALFYPGDGLIFASLIGGSDSLFFQYTRFQGGPRSAVFVIRGLGQYLPKMQDC